MKNKIKYTIVIVLLSLFTLILLYNNKITILSYLTKYQESTISTLLEESIYSKVTGKRYSKTLDKITNTEYFNKVYINEYLNILYIDEETFLINLNNLLDKGYKSKDINKIFQKLNNNNIQTLLEEEYLNYIYKLLSPSYFKEDNFKRYIHYYKINNTLDFDTIVTHVNIGLDNEFYSNINKIETPNDTFVLVNKYNILPNNFVPDKLQKLSSSSAKLTAEAANAFDKMCEDAKKVEINIYGGSGYRSYNHQTDLYNSYVKQDGKNKADTYSARPGHSEHQTGLAIDIKNSKGVFISEDTEEYTWLINNSYKYGFILRYPQNKEYITGYQYEPWHYRYLGIELATNLNNLNITYDEYVAKK